MILLTGATGLLGGHILYALLQKHDRVAALKREHSSTETLREIFSFYTDDPDALLLRIDWRYGDMLDYDSLVRALEGISCVVNCAAIVSFDPKDRKQLIRNNVEGTRNLVNAILEKTRDQRPETRDQRPETRDQRPETRVQSPESRDQRPETRDGSQDGKTSGLQSPVCSLIHVSSTAALGDSPGRDSDFRIDEETPRDPKRQHNGYSESKWQSEQVVWEAIQGERRKEKGESKGVTRHSSLVTSSASRLMAVILNPGIILGPGQWNKGSSLLFKQAWEGLKFYPFGGTGYVDVRDVAEVVVKIVDKWSSERVLSVPSNTISLLHSLTSNRYCLVGANLRYKEFFDKVTDEFGKPNPYIYAGKFLSGLAWRADTLRARLTGRYPLLTRETAESAQRVSFYSNEKIRKALGFEFREIGETLDWICFLYKTRDRRPETGDWRLETRDQRLETRDQRLETGD